MLEKHAFALPKYMFLHSQNNRTTALQQMWEGNWKDCKNVVVP